MAAPIHAPKMGIRGGKADDHRHRQRIGQAQYQHTHAAQGAQDERLRHLPRDKAGEGVVGDLQNMHGALSSLLGNGRQQALTLGQQVHGEHQRQQDGGGDAQGGVHHIAAVVGEEVRHHLGGVVGVHRQLRQCDAPLRRKGYDPVPPALKLIHIDGHIGHQRGPGPLKFLLFSSKQNPHFSEIAPKCT